MSEIYINNAYELARELFALAVGRNEWMAKCPAHADDKPSLHISVGRSGKTVVHCFGRCTQDEVLDALRDLGLWPSRGDRPSRARQLPRPIPHQQQAEIGEHPLRQLAKARKMYGSSLPATGTRAETYLRARGLSCSPVSSSIRFLQPLSADRHPAMIAAFGIPHEHRPGELVMPPERIMGVHLTLLKADGSGKAETDRDKLMVGPSSGWPIVLVPVNDVGGLVIAEGIEKTLSLCEATGLGGWAAGSANRLCSLAEKVPAYVETVTISVDDDPAGRRGSYELAQRLHARGIEVILFESANVKRAAA